MTIRSVKVKSAESRAMSEAENPKRKRRKDARPSEIVAAALAVFAEQGFAGAKIEEIARRAGVAKGTVYLYFATKEALFEAAVRENISPIFARLDSLSRQPAASAGERLTAVIHRVYAELIENPARRIIMQILIAEGSRFPQLTAFYHVAVISQAQKMLKRLLKQGVASGEFRQTPALKHPEIIMSPAMMAVVWKMTFDHIAPLAMKPYLQAHIDLVLNGLRP